MKKLNITKKKFNESRYFQTKYGKLEYVSESGNVYKTSKGHVISFNESGNFPILSIQVSDDDIRNSQIYKDKVNRQKEIISNFLETTKYEISTDRYPNADPNAVEEAQDFVMMVANYTADEYGDDEPDYDFALEWVRDIINGLKELAKDKTTYMSGNFADWSKYYNRQPMNTPEDVLKAAQESLYALGTHGGDYNFGEQLTETFYSNLNSDFNEEQGDELSEEAKDLIRDTYNVDV